MSQGGGGGEDDEEGGGGGSSDSGAILGLIQPLLGTSSVSAIPIITIIDDY